MAVDAQLNLQKAIYTALTGDVTLMAAITGVFDFVPQDTAYPYVTIGEDSYAYFGAMQRDGGEYAVQIDVWTQGEGRSSCKTIMGLVANVMHDGTLSITGNTHISTRLEFQDSFREEDDLTFHGTQRYKVYLHE